MNSSALIIYPTPGYCKRNISQYVIYVFLVLPVEYVDIYERAVFSPYPCSSAQEFEHFQGCIGPYLVGQSAGLVGLINDKPPPPLKSTGRVGQAALIVMSPDRIQLPSRKQIGTSKATFHF